MSGARPFAGQEGYFEVKDDTVVPLQTPFDVSARLCQMVCRGRTGDWPLST